MNAERELVKSVFRGVFKGSPKKSPSDYADENVVFSETEAAERPRYDSSVTPWAPDISDCARDPKTTECIVMKSSQTGITEAILNVFRWMVKYMPGKAALMLPNIDKAKAVFTHRLVSHFKKLYKELLTNDPSDITKSRAKLKSSLIEAFGSGSKTPWRETWYRFVLLDELEDHEVLPDGTSYDLAKSRFTTVSDYTLFVVGKPQKVGGPIHLCFLKGSQERWMIPCPYCEDKIELRWEYVQYQHCKDDRGEWDLNRVEAEAYYQCQSCGGAISENQKRAAVKLGEHQSRPRNERMMLKNKPVAQEPGVRSFHISDLYSSFPQVSLGKLAKKWVACAYINKSQAQMDDFKKNHLGLPVEPQELHVVDETILALCGGFEETVYYDAKNENGVIERRSRTVRHGEKFQLCYERGERVALYLPCDPIFLTISVDKQSSCLKYTVFAWQRDGQRWLVDYGVLANENELLEMQQRPYYVEGEESARYIYGGVFDRGYKSKEVYRCCRVAQARGWHLYPALGWGQANEKYRSEALSEKSDVMQGGTKVKYYGFHDHSVKVDFYFETIQNRREPRLWLPSPVPADIITELTSEFWDEDAGRFIHPDDAPPNDYADTMKMQDGVVWPVLSAHIMPE